MDRSTAVSTTTIVAVLVLMMVAAPLQAQPDTAQALIATAWCNDRSTGLSMHSTRLRFQADGMMQVRQEVDLANGSNNSKTMSARWELGPGLLIIHEPGGNQSRLAMAFAASGRQVTLGEQTYTACR
jgi:hypothetical protein